MPTQRIRHARCKFPPNTTSDLPGFGPSACCHSVELARSSGVLLLARLRLDSNVIPGSPLPVRPYGREISNPSSGAARIERVRSDPLEHSQPYSLADGFYLGQSAGPRSSSDKFGMLQMEKPALALCALTPSSPVSKIAPPRCTGVALPQKLSNRIGSVNGECEKGKYQSCFSLGVIFDDGDGVAKDGRRAAELYKRACDGGYADACPNLGLMHERGDGAAKDVTLASRLYQRGCDTGSLLSCSNLGAIYSNGTGVSKDEKLAVKLYQRACDGGIPRGCKRR